MERGAATYQGIHLQACKKQLWNHGHNKNYLLAYAKAAYKMANVVDNSKCHICYLTNDRWIFFIYALYQPYSPLTESLILHVQKSYLNNTLMMVLWSYD